VDTSLGGKMVRRRRLLHHRRTSFQGAPPHTRKWKWRWRRYLLGMATVLKGTLLKGGEE